jgi:copper(I)-binding protein
MNLKTLLCFLSIVFAPCYLNNTHADNLSTDISVSKAWVMAMPPSQPNSAAYMTISNNSSQEIVMTSVSSDIATSAEIHETSDINDMMHMATITSLHIPAGGSLRLKPGGFHIMLVNLKKPLKPGDAVPITLHFEDGSSATVNAKVRLPEEY